MEWFRSKQVHEERSSQSPKPKDNKHMLQYSAYFDWVCQNLLRKGNGKIFLSSCEKLVETNGENRLLFSFHFTIMGYVLVCHMKSQ